LLGIVLIYQKKSIVHFAEPNEIEILVFESWDFIHAGAEGIKL